ncbi:hypothetical protein BASA81_004234 [Batrachochytrium salamandrivorans]|nr:hypothetical protein BASA81_004234 [Batrachochytrium salamandrivorans]
MIFPLPTCKTSLIIQPPVVHVDIPARVAQNILPCPRTCSVKSSKKNDEQSDHKYFLPPPPTAMDLIAESVFTKHHVYEDDLLEAVVSGSEAKCMFLIDIFKVEVDCRDSDMKTPLQLACYHGLSKIAKLLLDRDANPNTANWSGMTPLHWCAYHGHEHLAKMLLNVGGGANLEQRNAKGFTPLQYCAFGSRECANVLLEHGAVIHYALPPRLLAKYDYAFVFKRWATYRQKSPRC